MKVLIFLFFIIFPFSFQTIQAAFYCEDLLPTVYLRDPSTGVKYLGSGNSPKWEIPNIFFYLSAEQGDTIQIDCYSYLSGDTYGGGCFTINNICRCYDFNTRPDPFQTIIRTTNLGGKSCSIPLRRSHVSDGTYSYIYRIPLDPNGVTCPTNVLIFLYDKEYSIELSNMITANFGLKNLEISITDNYRFFRLNGVRLELNNRFKILAPNLVFYSKESEKIRVRFTNYGISFSNKICDLYIRVCNQRCTDCYDSDSNDNNHQCKGCKPGYYRTEDNEYNCWQKNEMINSNYYFDEEEKIFRRCYKGCATCNAKSLENINNCTKCATSYHFIYNELNKGTCVHENNQPRNTYLDLATNTYELCHERCSRCNKKSDIVNNNCEECAKDDNGNFKFHFSRNENGKCLSEDEKPLNTYLDLEANQYRYCYEKCSLCDERGDESNNNCRECLKDGNNFYIYHFIYNETGRCLSESDKPSNTYLDLETNTYRKCYERCSLCDEGGDESNNNCRECLKYENNSYIFHFVYNDKGKCLSDDEKPSHAYLDLNDNTYKLSSESCASCYKKADTSNNNCIGCLRESLTHSYEIINGSDFISMVLSSDNMDPKEQLKKGISAIDLGECTEQIKEYYNI